MGKVAVKKSLFIQLYVPYWHKSQEMCGQIIIENGEMLKFNSEFCKNKMCDKAVDNYSHAL